MVTKGNNNNSNNNNNNNAQISVALYDRCCLWSVFDRCSLK